MVLVAFRVVIEMKEMGGFWSRKKKKKKKKLVFSSKESEIQHHDGQGESI